MTEPMYDTCGYDPVLKFGSRLVVVLGMAVAILLMRRWTSSKGGLHG